MRATPVSPWAAGNLVMPALLQAGGIDGQIVQPFGALERRKEQRPRERSACPNHVRFVFTENNLMRRFVMVLVCVAVVAAWSAPALAADCKGCAKVKEDGQGFCKACDKGEIFGLKLKSESLYTTLAGIGEGADTLAKSSCPDCQKAAKADGFCSHCKVGIVGEKLFTSKFAHTLAKGTPIDQAPTSEYVKACPACTKNAEDRGFCKSCSVGIVANRVYKPKTFYESALVAFDVMKKSIKAADDCEKCAVAMLMNGKCDACKVSYKDGEPSKG